MNVDRLRQVYDAILARHARLRRAYWSAKVERTCARHGGMIHANFKTHVSKSTYLGRNVHFNGMQIYGTGTVRIGDNFHSGPECVIFTQNHNYDNGDAVPYDKTYVVREVSIGDNVWLGTRVMILPGVSIGEGAIIQAGSVVVSDIPACAIAGGHPARVFSHRDTQHYHGLKEARRFW